MVGSCVHHLLYFNGNVLGISGVYGAGVRTVLGCLRGKEEPGKNIQKDQNGTTNGTGIKGEEKYVSEGSYWKLAFTAGLLAGGFSLRIARPYLESKLGIPLFDDAAVAALVSSPIAAFIGGAIVGVGTKVSL
jgi:hypothetical protein